MRRTNSRAFTLVELMIVMSLIAILVVIIISYFRSQIFKGTDARRKADVNRIKVALEEYEKDHDCYPLPQAVTCNPGTGLKPYLDRIPCDPVTKASYYYDYENNACPGWYRVYAKLDYSSDAQAVAGIGPNSAFNFVGSSANAPESVPGPSSNPSSPPPGGGGGSQQSGFYGCRSGICVQVLWDTNRPGPQCDPNYQSSTCYGQCGSPANECVAWH